MPEKHFLAIALIAAVSTGCAPGLHRNVETVRNGDAYQAQYRQDSTNEIAMPTSLSAAVNARKCEIVDIATAPPPPEAPQLLSRGDLLAVAVDDDETFTGRFEVSQDGRLQLPYLPAVQAQGLNLAAVEDSVAALLVNQQFYRSQPHVSVRVADFASAKVYVSGAVFEPGTAEVGGVAGRDRDSERQAAVGASTEARSLARALQFAGGVRPDADLSQVVIRRGGREITIDARPAIQGRRFADVMLLADDEIEVRSRGCFQAALVQPSPVTAQGVKVYLSNLTQPATGNAISAIGKDVREMRYGSRFVQAVFGMNCVGGARATNANRSAVLFSRNPVTGKSIVVERSIENLLERSDRDELDPFLMPGDAIACYDSAVTNAVEVARAFSAILPWI